MHDNYIHHYDILVGVHYRFFRHVVDAMRMELQAYKPVAYVY